MALSGDDHGCVLEKDRGLVVGPEHSSGADATSPEAGAENQGAQPGMIFHSDRGSEYGAHTAE